MKFQQRQKFPQLQLASITKIPLFSETIVPSPTSSGSGGARPPSEMLDEVRNVEQTTFTQGLGFSSKLDQVSSSLSSLDQILNQMCEQSRQHHILLESFAAVKHPPWIWFLLLPHAFLTNTTYFVSRGKYPNSGHFLRLSKITFYSEKRKKRNTHHIFW